MSQRLVDVPMLKVDEAMADEAVKLGKKIGIIATAHSTLKPTSDLVKQRAALAGKQVEIETMYCEGAFPALQRGDTATHDKMVKEKLAELQKRVDVIILAQASVARVIAQIPDSEKKVPILSSPRLGVQRLKEKLESLGKK
jgi:Asp/Glu/hydantoin racemase